MNEILVDKGLHCIKFIRSTDVFDVIEHRYNTLVDGR